jgi:hypothetical protein
MRLSGAVRLDCPMKERPKLTLRLAGSEERPRTTPPALAAHRCWVGRAGCAGARASRRRDDRADAGWPAARRSQVLRPAQQRRDRRWRNSKNLNALSSNCGKVGRFNLSAGKGECPRTRRRLPAASSRVPQSAAAPPAPAPIAGGRPLYALPASSYAGAPRSS